MSIEMYRQRPPGIPDIPLFPIPADVVRHHTHLFGEYGDEELASIRSGNVGVSDDPLSYVLNLEARPKLQVEEPTPQQQAAVRAYTAGALTAGAIIRRRKRLMERELDEPLETPPFDTDNAPVFGSATGASIRSHLLPSRVRLLLDRPDKRNVLARPLGYFADPESIAYVGLLKAAWRQHQVSFMSEGGEQTAAYISLGMGDVFETTAAQYWYRPHFKPKDVYYNQYSHRTDAHTETSWQPRPGSAQEEHPGVPDDETQAQLHVGRWSISGGYKAVLKGAGAEEKLDLWWNHHVPAGAQLEMIRSYYTAMVLPALDDERRVMRVLDRYQLDNVKLNERSQVIVRGRNGQFMVLEHPFLVTEDMTDVATRTVGLCRAVKYGRRYDISDNAIFTPDELGRLDELTEKVMQANKTLGNSAFHHGAAQVRFFATTAGISANLDTMTVMSLGYLPPKILLGAVGLRGLYGVTKYLSRRNRSGVAIDVDWDDFTETEE